MAAFPERTYIFLNIMAHSLNAPQTVDKVGAGIVSSTTFLHIAILLPKILKNQRILVF